MEARRLIDGASFGPDTLKAMGEAFDEAWAQIAGNFGEVQVENARLRLAEAVVSMHGAACSQRPYALIRPAIEVTLRLALAIWVSFGRGRLHG